MWWTLGLGFLLHVRSKNSRNICIINAARLKAVLDVSVMVKRE